MKTEVYTLTANGLEKAKQVPELPFGTRVYSFGSGMSEGVWAVYSKADANGNYPVVKMSKHYDDDYFSNPFNKLESFARPIKEKFGIGFYYDMIFQYSKSEVDDAINRANETVKRQQAKVDAKAKADADEKAKLPKLFPHLAVNYEGDQAITKKNLVAELKKHFPDIKFSVKKSNYSTYNVGWVDGVSIKKINAITKKFEDSCSSYCGDFRDYCPSNFNRVFGGFKYVSENRDYSDKIRALYDNVEWESKRRLNIELYDNDIPVNFESVAFDGVKLEFVVPEQTEVKEKPVKVGDIEIIDYSDKAIVVVGDTKPIKEQLKSIGGRFNFRLSCGAGWVFPKSKLSEVEAVINQ